MTASVTSPLAELAARFRQAIIKAYGPTHADVDPLVRRSDRADFQANLAMSLSKLVDVKPPRACAQALVDALDVSDICEKVEIAGPGFINLTLKNDTSIACAPRLRTTLAWALARSRAPMSSWSTTAAPTLPKRCTLAICARA